MDLDFDHVDITSTHNRWVKLARSLHRRRQRYRERAILVEGIRPLEEVLSAGLPVTALLLSSNLAPEDAAGQLARNFAGQGFDVFRLEPNLIELVADTESPQGVLAIVPMPELEITVPANEEPLFLVADGVRDPGNLGTLLRSALGAGVHGFFLGPESVDPFSPKVVRAGMGAQFRLAVQHLVWDDLPGLIQDCQIYAADMDAEVSYDEVNWQKASAIVVGNETFGVSPDASRIAHARVGIPLANRLESLNAAVAGSVIVFEAARQRRKG